MTRILTILTCMGLAGTAALQLATQAARVAGRSDYRRAAIADAVAGFAATEEVPVSTVRAWLAANAGGR